MTGGEWLQELRDADLAAEVHASVDRDRYLRRAHRRVLLRLVRTWSVAAAAAVVLTLAGAALPTVGVGATPPTGEPVEVTEEPVAPGTAAPTPTSASTPARPTAEPRVPAEQPPRPDPTPEPTATAAEPLRADLVVSIDRASWSFTVKNSGPVDSGSFVTRITGQQDVEFPDGLPAGDSSPPHGLERCSVDRFENKTVTVDARDEVDESDEDNNEDSIPCDAVVD